MASRAQIDTGGLLLPPAQIFDDVWSRFSTLGSLGKGSSASQYIEELEDFRDRVAGRDVADPRVNPEETTVLVLGATGRVGKVRTGSPSSDAPGSCAPDPAP